MDKQNSAPRVGIQVLVKKKDKILIGEDRGKGNDIWGVPGGKWKNGETLKEGARREVLEESGIKCDNLELNLYPAGKSLIQSYLKE